MARISRLVIPDHPHHVTQYGVYSLAIFADDDDRLLSSLTVDWRAFLDALDLQADEGLRRRTRTGRPVGDEAFVERLEVAVGRVLRPKTPGCPKRGGK